MKREQILAVLSGMRRAGQLSGDGPTSLFLAEHPGATRRTAAQLVVTVRGERVSVRTSRLPFAKPMTFTLAELDEVPDGEDR